MLDDFDIISSKLDESIEELKNKTKDRFRATYHATTILDALGTHVEKFSKGSKDFFTNVFNWVEKNNKWDDLIEQLDKYMAKDYYCVMAEFCKAADSRSKNVYIYRS